jgi:uncharacterized protein (DUF302 family)
MRHLYSLLVILASALPATAEMAPRAGWSVAPTTKGYAQLIDDVKSAATSNKMGIVTQAGPTEAAKNRGITIPGNRVIGIFNNAYAVDILNLSTAAMIEAPLRMYVTENTDGTATLSYKLPSTVFAPYTDEAGPELAALAAELDALFATISTQATD